jgi:hypothetical protein
MIDDKGMVRPMYSIHYAAETRERLRGCPMLLLRALDNPQNVSAIEDQKVGDKTLPAAVYTDGPYRYTILFDRTTKLPAAVRVREADNIWGDQNYDLVLSDWRAVNGAMIAFQRANFLGDMEIQRLNYKDIAANTPIPANAFEVRRPSRPRSSRRAVRFPRPPPATQPQRRHRRGETSIHARRAGTMTPEKGGALLRQHGPARTLPDCEHAGIRIEVAYLQQWFRGDFSIAVHTCLLDVRWTRRRCLCLIPTFRVLDSSCPCSSRASGLGNLAISDTWMTGHTRP